MSRENRGRRPAILQIFAGALKAWWDDDALRLGASLAYYTLFAIAPVLLVATGIAGLAFNTEAVREAIVNQLDHLVGREGAHAVQSLLEGAGQRRAGILAATIGSVAFIVAANGCAPPIPPIPPETTSLPLRSPPKWRSAIAAKVSNVP